MACKRDAGEFAVEARRKIAEALRQLHIFGRPRPVALYHYATAMDIEAIRVLVSPREDAAVSNMAHRRVVESSEFAIPAIFERCPGIAGPAERIDDVILREALELCEVSATVHDFA
jgi:hypothetical protein